MRLCILGLANIRLVYTSKQLIMLIQNSLFFVTVLPLLFSGDTLSEETRRGILYLKDIVLASDKLQSPITYIVQWSVWTERMITGKGVLHKKNLFYC